MAQQNRRNQQGQQSQGQQSNSMTASSKQSSGQQRGQGQQGQGQRGQSQSQGQSQDQKAQGQNQPQDLQSQILNAVTPAFNEVRTFVEGSPVRAATIGAIVGGALMTLISTEKGRTFARAAYDYANPMVAKYAREYISKAAGDMAESAIAH